MLRLKLDLKTSFLTIDHVGFLAIKKLKRERSELKKKLKIFILFEYLNYF